MPNLVSECFHYQVSPSSSVIFLLFCSLKGVADNRDQYVSLKKGGFWQLGIWLRWGKVLVFFSLCMLQCGNTHKLLVLEQVAVVGVGCRMLGHKAKDSGWRRQDGAEGDGGQRTGVQQKLRTWEMRRTHKHTNLQTPLEQLNITNLSFVFQNVDPVHRQENVHFALLCCLFCVELTGCLEMRGNGWNTSRQRE